VVEVDKALVAREKEGRKEEVSMLLMRSKRKVVKEKGGKIRWESAVAKVYWWPAAR